MSVIWCNVRPSVHGGGPSVFVHRIVGGLNKAGHKVVFDKNNADIALCIINAGKGRKRAKKVVLRINGIYNDLYNKKFNRPIRKDMIDLHDELRKNIPLMDHVVFQSEWSRDRINDEIVVRKDNYSIIHNGCDTNLFKPIPKKQDGIIKLIHCGRMRDAYLMEMLIGTYLKVKQNHNAKLLLIGGMDAGCTGVYNRYSSDKDIVRLGVFPNTQLTKAYNQGDIFLDVRQGCSSNNIVSEAQACGLPIVVPSWSGDSEMIVDGKTGIIVDGGKWDYNDQYIQRLADGVEQIIPDLQNYKIRARKHAEKELTIDKMVDKYLKAMGI